MNEPIIWVVDDDEDDQYFMRDAFYQLIPPIEVKSLYDGDELLSCLKEAKMLPQLVLLDLNMPRVNGFEVLSQVRAIPAYREIPIIVLSTSVDSIDKEKAIKLKATDALLKPSNLNQLFALIQQLVIKWEVTC